MAATNSDIRVHPVPTCYLCGKSGVFLYRAMRDRLFDVPGEWSFRQCPAQDCGLIWLDPMPIEEELFKAYRAYYTHAPADIVSPPARRSGVRRILHLIYALLLKATGLAREREALNSLYLHRKAPGKLLEVGCGNGERLAEIRALGWQVEGQDVDPRAIECARTVSGLTVHLGALSDLSLPESTFDAVIMNHVIEHVPDPVMMLHACHRLLRKGGHLIAVTPNIESYGYRKFGAAWLALDPPRHLHLFSQRTLRQTAGQAGFHEASVWTTPANAQMMGAAAWDITRSGHHVLGTYSSTECLAYSAWFQLSAKFFHLLRPWTGEECVLRAIR